LREATTTALKEPSKTVECRFPANRNCCEHLRIPASRAVPELIPSPSRSRCEVTATWPSSRALSGL